MIKNLFDYREDEDANIKALDSDMLDHLNKVLLVEGSKIENIEDQIQFYDIKITEPPPEEELLKNEFDIAKKEEYEKSDDDYGDEEEEEKTTKGASTTIGKKRPPPAGLQSKASMLMAKRLKK